MKKMYMEAIKLNKEIKKSELKIFLWISKSHKIETPG